MQFLESSGKADGKVAPGFQEGMMRVVGGRGSVGPKAIYKGSVEKIG